MILVDELQANSQDVRELVAVYQELIGENLNVALVMAGLPGAVSATLNDRVLTFLNHAKKVTLAALPAMDIEAFYAGAFKDLGVDASPAQVSRAARGPGFAVPDAACWSRDCPARGRWPVDR